MVAPDLRGHGGAATGADADFSAETMTADVVAIWRALFAGGGASGGVEAGGGGGGEAGAPAPPSPARVPTLLVGHSMGAALVVRAAATGAIAGLEGVAVIDVVEGTAIGAPLRRCRAHPMRLRHGTRAAAVTAAAAAAGAPLSPLPPAPRAAPAAAALPHMGAILRARPQRFASQQAAADWAVRSGTCKRPDAAGVSFPSQVVPADGGGEWRWRTPLEASEPFWEGWYRGLSALLLGLPVPKMLLLAGTDRRAAAQRVARGLPRGPPRSDAPPPRRPPVGAAAATSPPPPRAVPHPPRLDRELTIGQMQGKFQLVLMPKAGHAIQEDEPEATAAHLAAFLHRFRVGEPPMVIPRAPGARPVLPVVAGPLHVPGSGGARPVP